MEKVIHVQDLNVTFPGTEAVRGVNLSLHAGELLALAGESGSGKTTLCRALLGLPPKGSKVTCSLLQRPAPPEMSLVMQDALTALDPAMPVGKQITEGIRICPPDPAQLLSHVGIDNAAVRVKQYPLEFSGGMCQRAAIALAMASRPKVIFADEPTTSLDSAMRLSVMQLLNKIRQEGTAILLVTHDLYLVRDYADRVMIMKEGAIVESGTPKDIFGSPQDEYTKELIRCAAISDPKNHTHGKVHYHDMKLHSHEHIGPHTHESPEPDGGDKQQPHCAGPGKKQADQREKAPPLIRVEALSKYYPLGYKNVNKVLKDIDLSLYRGEITGLYGPSGIGKSTLARCIAGIEKPTSGKRIADKDMNIQMIFQDSVSAFNPRMTVRQIIGEPLYLRDKKSPARETILDLMADVQLDAQLIERRPRELSAGQRQRVAIARAIALKPDLIIADEPLSSLDATTSGKIVHLLKNLKDDYDLTMLLISHDLPLLAHVSDRIVRM